MEREEKCLNNKEFFRVHDFNKKAANHNIA